MNPIEAVSSVFRNYINFQGRARRSEFWWFALFSFFSQIVLNWIPFIGWLYALALLLPSLAVTARRLHDSDRTAWWMLLYLVPIVGLMFLVIFFFATIGASALDPWSVNEVRWGILGLFFLIWFLASIVSWIALLIFCILPGTAGPNRYGADPLQPQQDTGGLDYPHPDHTYAPPATSGYGTAGQLPPQTHSSANPISDSGEHRYCTQCGMQMQPEAQFCTFCGTAV